MDEGTDSPTLNPSKQRELRISQATETIFTPQLSNSW